MKVTDSRIITVQTKDANGAEIMLKLSPAEAMALRDELVKLFPVEPTVKVSDEVIRKLREAHEPSTPNWPSTWPTYPTHKPCYPWEVTYCVSSMAASCVTTKNAKGQP